jgi:hypothetical protein
MVLDFVGCIIMAVTTALSFIAPADRFRVTVLVLSLAAVLCGCLRKLMPGLEWKPSPSLSIRFHDAWNRLVAFVQLHFVGQLHTGAPPAAPPPAAPPLAAAPPAAARHAEGAAPASPSASAGPVLPRQVDVRSSRQSMSWQRRMSSAAHPAVHLGSLPVMAVEVARGVFLRTWRVVVCLDELVRLQQFMMVVTAAVAASQGCCDNAGAQTTRGVTAAIATAAAILELLIKVYARCSKSQVIYYATTVPPVPPPQTCDDAAVEFTRVRQPRVDDMFETYDASVEVTGVRQARAGLMPQSAVGQDAEHTVVPSTTVGTVPERATHILPATLAAGVRTSRR